ncbi:MAG TPA: VCBS repeat-containing protein, partial [Polyangiaceae bacterium]|nr:VCBS repeat-containing protein [Polyangiaceae bacterium]
GLVHGGAGVPDELSVVLESPDALGAVSRALDFDNDGTLEVFVGAGISGAIVWRNTDFDPEEPERFIKLSHGTVMTVADHDGDGRDDVAFGSGESLFWLGSFTSFNVTARQIVVPDDVEATPNIVY